jgi:hypothetical protein
MLGSREVENQDEENAKENRRGRLGDEFHSETRAEG